MSTPDNLPPDYPAPPADPDPATLVPGTVPDPTPPGDPSPDAMSAQNTPAAGAVETPTITPQPPAPDQPELIGASAEPPVQPVKHNPANAPTHTRVPLLPYTLYLFAAAAKHAQNFALACLDPQQPWTFIEDATMLKGLMGVNVFQFSDALLHPDADDIQIALVERRATIARHPDELPRMPLPPDNVVLTVSDVAGSDDAATVVRTLADVNPMSLPTRG